MSVTSLSLAHCVSVEQTLSATEYNGAALCIMHYPVSYQDNWN